MSSEARQRNREAQWLDFGSYVEADCGYETPCWIYCKQPTQRGYIQMRMPDGSQPMAHRAFYELHVGPIPRGLTLDHLCKETRCVNPAHLEPVTRGENSLRGDTIVAANKAKMRCKRGHPFDERNTYVYPDGRRACRACWRDRARSLRLGVPWGA